MRERFYGSSGELRPLTLPRGHGCSIHPVLMSQVAGSAETYSQTPSELFEQPW